MRCKDILCGRLLAFLLMLLIASVATGAQVVAEPERPGGDAFTGTTMGPIRYRVTVADRPANISAEQMHQLIQQSLDEVDQLMSTYRDDSDVSRFNAYEQTDWFSVNPLTAHVLGKAQRISEVSGGAFDVTVMPLVNLWGFGPAGRDVPPPTAEQIQDALERVGYRYLEVREEPPAIRKLRPEITIDLSGIAKGFAVDQVAAALRGAGSRNFIVEVGGEVYAAGVRDDQNNWRIGISVPVEGSADYDRIITLVDQAIASSGDYRNVRRVDGQRISHTIDPKTGRPIDHGLASVNVIADDCLTADAVATAVMVLGVERGHALSHQLGLHLYTVQNVEGQMEELYSDGYPFVAATAPRRNTAATTFIAAFVIFLIALVAMALGVIISNRRIHGSCGGIASLKRGSLSPVCSACARPTQQCEELREAMRQREQQV